MNKLQNVKGVFWDLGGTLLYPPSGSFMFSDLAKKYFAPEKLRALPPRRVKAAEAKAWQALHQNPLVLAMEEEYRVFLTYYTALSEELELGLGTAQLEEVARDKIYNKTDNYRLFDDSIETLRALHGKYRLGIISDTWPSIVPVLEQFDALRYFDFATYSFELGAVKPDPRMYRDALEKMGLPAGETVFVDDTLKNLHGAAALGIQTVQICAGRWSPSLDRTFGIDGVQAAEQAPEAAGAPEGQEPPRITKISQLLELLD